MAHVGYLREQLELFANKFQVFNVPSLYHFYTDLSDAAEKGLPSTSIKNWPEDMWVQKFILLNNEIDRINKIFEKVDKSRGYSLRYNSKRI